MAAVHEIAAGKGHTEWVHTTFGASVKIFDALNNPIKHLPAERFHAEDLDTVDRAFDKLGLNPTSDRKDEIAQNLLTHFVPRRSG